MKKTPIDLSPKVGYLHSIYTEVGMRGNNLADRIVEAALGHCRMHAKRKYDFTRT